MHNYLTIRVIRKVKYHLFKIMKYKLLEQNLQVMTYFIQLGDKLLFHMQVINMLSQKIYALHFSNNFVAENTFLYGYRPSTTTVS